MSYKQQPITERAAQDFAQVLTTNQFPAEFVPTATRDWLAKVRIKDQGNLCIYANSLGELKLQTHEYRGKAADLIKTLFEQIKPQKQMPAGQPGVHIYTDGSHIEEGEAEGYGYALIVLLDGKPIHEETGPAPHNGTRNVAGEIEAVTQALGYCLRKGYKDVTIHHDYNGIDKFASGEFEAQQENSIRFVKKLRDFKDSGLNVEFIWTKAHNKDFWNEHVDQLAKKAARKDHGSTLIEQRRDSLHNLATR